MIRWYYSTNGKAEGPVAFEFLIEQLKAGKFRLIDLVFKEGESAWKTFGEIPEFREAYQAPPPLVPPVPTQPTEVNFDDISIDDFTPTPILTQTAPAVTAVPVNREEPVQRVAVAAPVQPLSQIVVPESTSVKGFEKPEEGWPSDWRLSSSWIVLRKKPDGSGYEQEGPYSAEHIIEMIGTGKIEYSQYCWKPGYTRWFRIGNLPEFDRRKRDRDNDTVNQIIPVPSIAEALPALTREELLANVERLRRDKRGKEKAPPETNGKNLIETPIDRVSPEPVILPESRPVDFDRAAIAPAPAPVAPTFSAVGTASTSAAASVSSTPISTSIPSSVSPAMGAPAAWKAATVKKNKVSQKTLRIGIAAFVAIVVVFALMQMATSRGRQPASQQMPPAKSQPQKRGRAQSQNEAAPAAAPPVATAPPHVASSLEINPKNLETAAVLSFQTDMSPQDKIVVKVKAHTGDILNFTSFAKTFDVLKPASGEPQLDLVKEGLPQGTYFVEASVGSAQASTQIFIGKRDDQFLSELERHIKSISLRQQSEKFALYYGAQKLEKLAKELKTDADTFKTQPLKWAKTYKAWRLQAHEAANPVAALASSPPNDIAYPDEIAAFQAASEKLAALAKDYDTAITQKRDVASAPDDISAEFGKVRENSAKLSGRPQASN